MSALGAQRLVLPETLDELAPEDPQAQRSRLDLRRVNRLMGSCSILTAALRAAAAQAAPPAPLRLLELGAGDGQLMLRVARALRLTGEHSRSWGAVELWLLDRQALVSASTVAAYARAGWRAQPLVCDVRDWMQLPVSGPCYDIIVVNLFLHHFDSSALRALLAAVAARCKRFLACEPRRSVSALLGSHLLGAIGANRVTRHDAVLSVRAGFCNHELSDHWPMPGWERQERAAGLFSHLFCAWRTTQSGPGQSGAAAV
jgi:hypothetical protein